MSATTTSLIIHDPRWQAVKQRDTTADGQFVYAVKTTGIYCRPSCFARLAKPEHIIFYNTKEQAEAAGFRPCKRCKPEQFSLQQRYTEQITKLCQYIEQAGYIPSLAELAAYIEMSRYHLHRIFKRITGLTPKQYAVANQTKRIRQQLSKEQSVTAAIYEAGYNSNSRFYEKSKKFLGMTATRFKAGGKDTQIYFAIVECSLGSVLVAQSKQGICAIAMGDDPELLINELQDRFPMAQLMGGDQPFEQLVAQVISVIESPQINADLPLDIRGTVFQQKVWQALQQIPVGQTATYSDIAKQIGLPNSVRAVANACAANKLAVLIPCHRVVRQDGNLSGYRWGVERKRTLLMREANK